MQPFEQFKIIDNELKIQVNRVYTSNYKGDIFMPENDFKNFYSQNRNVVKLHNYLYFCILKIKAEANESKLVPYYFMSYYFTGA